MRERLERDRPAVLGLAEIPNARLWHAARTARWLTGGEGPESAGAWREHLARAGRAGVDPEELRALGESLGYLVELSWARHGAEGAFDAVLVRGDHRPISWPDAPAPSVAAGDPLAGKLARRLVPDLRRHLAARLPEPMLPSAYVVLDRFLLSPAGEIDRKALPAPDGDRPEVETAYVAPRGVAAERISAVWREVLGLERVGARDNFFDLGGHSLLPAQVHARLAGLFEKPFALVDLLAHPTIASLASFLSEGAPTPGPSSAIEERAARGVAAARPRRGRNVT